MFNEIRSRTQEGGVRGAPPAGFRSGNRQEGVKRGILYMDSARADPFMIRQFFNGLFEWIPGSEILVCYGPEKAFCFNRVS